MSIGEWCDGACDGCDCGENQEELALDVGELLREINPDDLEGNTETLEILRKALLCATDEDDDEALAYVRDIIDLQEETGEVLEDLLSGSAKRLWFEIMEVLD